MPQRKAPSERLQRAAAAAAGVELQDDEDAPLRFSIRPGAPRWEAWLARVLQVRWSGSAGRPKVLQRELWVLVCTTATYVELRACCSKMSGHAWLSASSWLVCADFGRVTPAGLASDPCGSGCMLP
jgi:hypothetical protein